MYHKTIVELLTQRFAPAIAAVAGRPVESADPQIRSSGEARFGDYQCNVAMGLAKILKAKPRELAERIVAAVDVSDIAEPLEIAGAGFINIRVKSDFLAQYLSEIEPAPPETSQSEDVAAGCHADGRSRRHEPGDQRDDGGSRKLELGAQPPDRLGIPLTTNPRRVVIDYSSPNIAKQLHVGHLRSTVIGDCFARVLTFEGHAIRRQNHLGDWGTPVGMVILGLWYIQSRYKRHGESPATVQARLAQLNDWKAQPVEFRRDRLAPICADWSTDVKDAALDDYSKYDVTIEDLELGYRFIQALMATVDGTSLEVTDRDGKTNKLVELPRKITSFLQRGDPVKDASERQAWQRAREISLADMQQMYDRLGVLLQRDDACGESFYQFEQDRIRSTLDELREKLKPPADAQPRDKSQPLPAPYAEMRQNAGAWCIFFYDENHQPRFRRQDGGELPMIVQKTDGAYLYASTDLAAILYRIKEIDFHGLPGRDAKSAHGADRIIYTVGATQMLQLQMLFAAARAAGWATPDVLLEHTPFGNVLGQDGKIMKTRAGENVKLVDLLDEAERRALALLEEREQGTRNREQEKNSADGGAGSADQGADLTPSPPRPFTPSPAHPLTPSFIPDAAPLSTDQKREIAKRVGVAAIKYFDLNRDRIKDYVFDWDKMLAFQGNTAPYMMYAYARIRSIYRKAAERFGQPDVYAPTVRLRLDHPAERALALRLTRAAEAIAAVARDLSPHVLCTYLYDLAAEFMKFYETCPVLAAADQAQRLSRMRLCDLAARTLRLGLWLVGIETLEQM